jgi:hypothetical protein
MNKAFHKYCGEPGVPSDLKGLHYAASAMARLYGEMLDWYNDIKSASVEDAYTVLRDSFALFTIKASEQIWNYPKQVRKDIFDGLERIKSGEKGPINIQSILKLETDEEALEIFHSEMNKLEKKYK